MSRAAQTMVDENLFESDGDLTTYNGLPFTGIGFDPFPGGSGVEYETTYKDGLPHGLKKRWYSNGKLAYEINYKNGLKNGLERHWHTDGKLKSELEFQFGIKVTGKIWDSSGDLIEEFRIDRGSENFKILEKRRQELE